MDADRRREVVRLLRDGAAESRRHGHSEAMLEAANVLEEMGEAPLQVTDHAYQPLSTDPRFCGCGVAAELHTSEAPKPSAASMEERIRDLEGEMEHIRNSVRGARIGLAQNGPGWLLEWFDGIERRADRALHPHAPWCRDPSHDDPCIPEETEVERDD